MPCRRTRPGQTHRVNVGIHPSGTLIRVSEHRSDRCGCTSCWIGGLFQTLWWIAEGAISSGILITSVLPLITVCKGNSVSIVNISHTRPSNRVEQGIRLVARHRYPPPWTVEARRGWKRLRRHLIVPLPRGELRDLVIHPSLGRGSAALLWSPRRRDQRSAGCPVLLQFFDLRPGSIEVRIKPGFPGKASPAAQPCTGRNEIILPRASR